MLKTAALLVVLAVVAGTLAGDYCSLCQDHTMCKYKGPGPKCARILQSGLDATQLAEVVTAHNDLRRRVAKGKQRAQPGAANMRKMVWDDELATVAQRWADQCDFNHDSCRKVTRFSVGQNLFISSSTAGIAAAGGSPAKWRDAVQAWFDEVKDFDKRSISPFKFSSGIGHYSQLVWAESSKLGCGFTQFQDGGWLRSLHVCNYGVAGNMMGGDMYLQGQACSQCPRGTTCQDGLCA